MLADLLDNGLDAVDGGENDADRVLRRGDAVAQHAHHGFGGMADPLPMLALFDKQVQLRMGQANVMRWVDEILPLLTDDDPLGVDEFATHHLPLSEGPDAYRRFQEKQDGVVKVILHP